MCLQTLKDQGKVLLVATSKPEKFAKEIIDHFDLTKYFDFVGGSELNGRSKKGEVIDYVLKSMIDMMMQLWLGIESMM